MWKKKIIIVFAVFAVLFATSFMIEAETRSSFDDNTGESVLLGEKEISVYYFYGDGCPACGRVKPFIVQMEHEHSATIYQYEIYHNRDNVELLNQYFDTNAVPVERRGIPALFVSDSYLVGSESILDRFGEVISEVQKKDSLVGHKSGFEVESLRNLGEGSACSESAGKPGCPPIVSVTIAALIDSLSPCSLGVLIFLIGVRPLVANRKKRALKMGLAFSFSVFLTYTLFGLGLLSVVRITNLSSVFGAVAGLVAILVGILYVKDYFWHDSGGFSMEIPRSLKPLVNRMIKSVTSPIGAFFMGFVICCLELPCTGGPYLFILGQLANTMTRLQAIPALLYYNFVFITPLILISLLLYFGLSSIERTRKWTDGNKGLLRLGSGLALAAMGILVIPDSQLIWLIRTFLSCCKVVLPPVLFALSFYLIFSFLRVHQVRTKRFSKTILLAALPVLSIFAYSQLVQNVNVNVDDPDMGFAVSEFPSMRTLEHSEDADSETFCGGDDVACERPDDFAVIRQDSMPEPEKTTEFTAEELARIEESLQREHEIRLESRSFVPEKGVSSALLDVIAAKPEFERIHVMIQFTDIPHEDERQVFENYNVTILNYVPEYAYIASLNSAAVENIANLPNVRAIIPILPEDKISPHIKEGRYAYWAVTDNNELYLYVQLHEDVSFQEGIGLVEQHGGEVNGYWSTVNTLFVTLHKNNINVLAKEDGILWIQQVTPPLTALNDGARAALDVNTVQVAPYNLDGTGIDVTVYDSGTVFAHTDFTGRLTLGNTDTMSAHSTHVAGTLGGDGSLSGGRLRGMAPNVDIISFGTLGTLYPFFYNASGNLEDVYNQSISTYGSEFATDSVGSNIARLCSGPPDRCAELCPLEGDYELTEALIDEITRGSLGEKFLSVWAAGNERSYGDCGSYYNTIGIPAGAKNIITIGATNTNDNSMTDFSSWGPVDDGRLKPELVGPGCQVGGDGGINSTYPNMWPQYIDYDTMCGTSMATPAVSGVIALMLQQMKQLRGAGYMPWPSTIKTILVQTAIDLNNTGPDYATGYGHVDAKEAVDLIIRDDDLGNELIRQGYVADDDIDTYLIYVPAGLPELKVTLAWDDPAAAPLTGDDLVNDLDLYLRSPSGTNHYAYKLDPANPADPATTGFNFRDNLEQVVVSNPESGIWEVKAWGWVVTGNQSYSVVFPYEQIQCGGYIYEDVTLTTDYTCTGTAFRIGNSGITIDCNGHTLQGSGTGYGIENTRNDVTITNCTIIDFDYGIYMHDIADFNHLLNNNVLSNDVYGIYLDDAWSNEIRDNDVNLNAISGDYGLFVYDSRYNDILHNSFEGNDGHAIRLSQSNDNSISYNDVRSSTSQGVSITFSNYTTISFNNITENGVYGIYIYRSQFNDVLNNFIDDTSSWSIYLLSSNDTEFRNNIVNHPISLGVFSSNSNNTVFNNNTVCGFSWDFYTSSSTYDADGNTCDSANLFVDSGQPDACDYKCSGCRRPEADTYIYENITLCPGTYNIPDTGSTGVLIVQNDLLTLDCSGAVLIGDGSGAGILVNGPDGITISNCTIENYYRGLDMFTSGWSYILRNEFIDNSYAGIFLDSSSSCVVDSNLAYSNPFGIYLDMFSINNHVQFNDAIGNDYGIYVVDDQNYVHNNIVEENTNTGVLFGPAANNNELNNNIVCANSLDINDMDSNSGDDNFCDTTSNWNDDGTTGCTFACPRSGDVAVTNVTLSKTVVGQGYSMSINVTVENQGDYTETFNVTAYYGNATITPVQWETFWSMGDVNRDGYINETDEDLIMAALFSEPGDPNWCSWADLNQDDQVGMVDLMEYGVNTGKDIWALFISGAVIGTQTVYNLPPGSSPGWGFIWDTTGFPYGNYTIGAYATPIFWFETDRADNTYTDSDVMVTIPGDVNGDRIVDIFDIGTISAHWYPGPPIGPLGYHPNADINDDGAVDIFDIGIVSAHWGESW